MLPLNMSRLPVDPLQQPMQPLAPEDFIGATIVAPPPDSALVPDVSAAAPLPVLTQAVEQQWRTLPANGGRAPTGVEPVPYVQHMGVTLRRPEMPDLGRRGGALNVSGTAVGNKPRLFGG